jgi:hypothetical protein
MRQVAGSCNRRELAREAFEVDEKLWPEDPMGSRGRRAKWSLNIT